MKLNNYILLFFSLFLILYLPIYHYGKAAIAIGKEQLRYNRNLENAVEDGLFHLVEKDSSKEIVLNKEQAAENFYQSLFSNFGLLTNPLQQEKLKQCIPILLIADKDGFYINSSTIRYDKDGNEMIEKCWKEKIPYLFNDKNFVYEFTLGDEVKLFDKSKNLLVEGDYHDFAGKYPNNIILNHPATFEKIRRKCIIGHLKEALEEGIQKHKKITKKLGISYQFFLPTIEKEDWYRTIDDISMIVVFQGYPWSSSCGTFNRYAIGGARIWKHYSYYASVSENGIFCYHKETCCKRRKMELKYSTKKECAENGAFPCTLCNP